MTSAIVIGGEGFIGRHLVKTLRAQGTRVIVVGRPKRDAVAAEDLHRIDLTDPTAVAGLFDSFPGAQVYYLAATTRPPASASGAGVADLAMSDIVPLLTTVEVAAQAATPPRCFVRAGSLAEYGFSRVACAESHICRPATVYGATILAGTGYLGAMSERVPFPITTARLGLTYGTGQSQSFLAARLLAELSAGRPVRIARPMDRRPMIHVDDVVAGLMAIAQCASPPPIVNLAPDRATSMGNLARRVIEALDASCDLVCLDPMPGPSQSLFADAKLARRRLGWTAQLDLRQGLARSLPVRSELAERAIPAGE
ncbi:dTDP-6-deoxy-L-talose 4-dehydrogenase (NAD(P)(+)) [Rhodobacteraceae bacterium THAF1]|uniref:NAD-dependent epimerase/dehydratase family protein n=1 Tax=Palleronia sp. THAF1 TaxID=2587842 RepID=UPI000F40B36D|nr:NAD(P)-dependent oxidoreductase [Palleronia sp. THAF1]QFU10325.1 dTDP-6-deoxy-L-talose 4-dehydrogenase (NAD(P)(+)) [Palleronia sp. THAF1]VDC31443.1 dTDP-6-deoxy-L-talose 4-dehydrogenase (NAD(P)(+)) [Rhodobacteraceae bacterium THAF1]